MTKELWQDPTQNTSPAQKAAPTPILTKSSYFQPTQRQQLLVGIIAQVELNDKEVPEIISLKILLWKVKGKGVRERVEARGVEK